MHVINSNQITALFFVTRINRTPGHHAQGEATVCLQGKDAPPPTMLLHCCSHLLALPRPSCLPTVCCAELGSRMDVLRRYLRRKAPQVAPEPEGGSCQHPQTESCPSSRMAWEAGPGHPRRWSCSALLTGRKPAPRTGAEQRDTTSRPRWRWPKFNLGRQDSAHGRSQATQLWVCFCWKACPQPSRVGQQEASPGQELGDRCLSCLTVAGEESSHSLEVPCNTEAEWSSTAETPTNQSEKDLAPEEKAEENEDPAAGEEEEEELETEEEEKQEEQVLITEKEEEMEDLAIKEEEDLTTEEKDEADISVEEEKKEDENMSAEEEEEEEEEENVSAEEEEEEHLSTEEEEDLTTEKEEEEEGKRRGRRR
ncbi:coiled-coil domain-containing glutamate-rich protein 1-like isoform X2 [Mauremys mutica]|nr:coiled-coil domain-containing glutamate-rich protein 1-like isoform X2 [Mauremys mutica]XP_044856504.1 coiled-coil domain-containing glutamate-rich protein 1-like isoform X2 [Mauremys mutica]XP_044857020.1 coiled-coil domain-containing glutamate-rich protein 1-like isoform X2 [Mauremys mutica]XP_044857184.1 coiled-coil domain-containing glutamate-rich protein 1-like isoform X2 [Mauremys mutica]